VDAAGLGATAPVSYGALITRGRLKKGETVLIHAAAGGLGLMAVQLAKAAGVIVIATASTEAKLTVAWKYGADECVNYIISEDWWKEVLVLTDEVGVDLVFDSVGLVDKSLKCLKHKGRLLVVGFAGTEGMIEKIAMNRILLKQAQIFGYVSRSLMLGRKYSNLSSDMVRATVDMRRRLEQSGKTWWQLIHEGFIRPCVYDHVYKDLSSVPSALNDLAARKVWGKGVIRIGEDQPRANLWFGGPRGESSPF
jgi:NADPH:quinone reductase